MLLGWMLPGAGFWAAGAELASRGVPPPAVHLPWHSFSRSPSIDSPSFPPEQNVTAGANPISIKRGIDKTCEYLVRAPPPLPRYPCHTPAPALGPAPSGGGGGSKGQGPLWAAPHAAGQLQDRTPLLCVF